MALSGGEVGLLCAERVSAPGHRRPAPRLQTAAVFGILPVQREGDYPEDVKWQATS